MADKQTEPKESKYAKKQLAKKNFLSKEGNTYPMWLEGRRNGTIKIS